MTVHRSISEDEELTLKAAVRRSLRAGGGAASVQHMVGADETTLSRYAGQAYPDRHAKITDAIEIDRNAGVPVIVSAMAEMLGFRLVAIDQSAHGEIDTASLLAAVSAATDFVSAVAEADRDNTITTAELGGVDRKGEGAIAAIRKVQAVARAKAGKALPVLRQVSGDTR